jgi:hypothetical protein
MGRPKGFKMTEEHKQKLKEGRLLSRKRKVEESIPIEKPICYITGKEMNGFNFWEPLRKTFRPLHKYSLLHSLEQQIVNVSIWKNVEIIKNVLSSYVVFEFQENKNKKTKERKKRTYKMTEEHKEKIRNARKKK